MHLLDAAVVAELRLARTGRADPGLCAWAGALDRQTLFISALTLLEIENAAAGLDRRDRPAAEARRTWIDEQLMPAFEGRILPIDAAVVRRRARLAYANARDGLLAATALEHGLTLVVRNPEAFAQGRVKTFNPWGYSPEAAEDADWRQAVKGGSFWLQGLFVRS